MRSSVAARIRRAVLALPAMLLAFTLMPSTALADAHAPAPLAGEFVTSRTYALPASSLSEATAVTITSGVVELATDDAVAPLASALSTIRTTYVAAGCVYAFDERAGEFTLVNAANAERTEDGYLVVPSALVLDGVEHPVTSVAAGALSDTDAVLVALSSNIASVDAAAARGNAELQALYVSPDNEAYASYDGCLYSEADGRPISLLLVPEGKQGAVRIASGAEVEDPETFSHCVFADQPSVDAGSAASLSRNVFIPTDDGADVTAASPLGEPIMDVADALDIDTVVIDEDAFAPVPVLVPETASAEAPEIVSVDAPLGASIEDEAAIDALGGPIERDATGLALSSRAVEGANANFRVLFDANGTDDHPVSRGYLPTMKYTNGSAMPDLASGYTSAKAPKRSGFVFMGIFDGSDWERANRYYNSDFTQTGCVTTYGFPEGDLTLYAGWAPVLKVDVPASVGVALGTVEEIDAPRGTTAAIKNLSPWDVVCTSLEWDAEEVQGEVNDADVKNRIDNTIAESAVVDGHADAKVLDASTNALSELFDDVTKVTMRITDVSDATRTGTIKPGSKTTESADIGHIALSAATAENPIVEKEFTYNFELNGAKVKTTDAVSNTTLFTAFQTANVPKETVRASVLFDQNGCDDAEYAIEAKTAVYGQAMPAIPEEGISFVAPSRTGYTFEGYFDTACPVWDGAGELVAGTGTKYYDADGASARAWDKTRATVLYAGWRPNGCALRLHGNGGTIIGEDLKPHADITYTVAFDAPLSSGLPSGLPTAEYKVGKEMETSDSWWTDPVGGERVTDSDLDAIPMKSTEGLDLYAHWDVNSMPLAVTLHGNGGTFGSGADAAGDATFTTTVNDLMAALGESGNTPVNPGYTLRGWSMKPSIAADVDDDLITSAPPVIGTLELYAHWRAKDVTVSWDMGTWTGAGAPSAPEAHTFTFSDQTLGNYYPAARDEQMRTGRGDGYAWQGWFATDEKGDKTGSSVSASTKIPYDSTRYTAFWAVTYTWLANDAVFTTTTQASGGTTTIAPPATAPTRTGYDFAGWYLASDHTTPLQAADGTYAPAIAPATYEAHWEPHQITLTLNANGGSFAEEGAPASKDILAAAGSTIELPGKADVTRDGYEFAGWYTTSACSEDTRVTSSVMPDEDDVYYAKWAGATVTFHWDSDGGSAVADTFGEYGPSAKLPMPADPTRAGYKFAGWYTDKTYANQVGASTPMPPTAQTFYAKWTGKTVSITWNVAANEGSWQGGSNSGTNSPLVTTQTYSDGGKVVLPTEAQGKPVKFGNAFAGWYTTASSADGSTQVDANTVLPQGADGADTVSVTYYARFDDAPSAVTFDLDGGVWNMPSNVSVSASVREELMPTIKDGATNATAPVKAGYTFEGFYFTDNGVETKYYNADLSSAHRWDRASATQLKAKWTPLVYEVVFKDTSGALNPNPVTPGGATVTAGQGYDIPSGVTWAWEGHDFLGWALTDGAKTAAYQSGDAIAAADVIANGVTTNGTPTLYIYPVWKPTYGSVSFDDLSEEDKGFYLPLAEKVTTEKLTMEPGYYGASDIKVAAVDISDKGTNSEYYEAFKTIMDKDYKFKSNWYNVSSNNANTHLDTTYEYDVRIIGFNQDYLSADKNGKRAGITFQFADCTLSWAYRFNIDSTSINGWKNSELRARMNGADYQALNLQSGDNNARSSIWSRAPIAIQKNVQPVYKFTHITDHTTNATLTPTRDVLFVPSYAELVRDTSTYYVWYWGPGNAYSWKRPADETVYGGVYQYWYGKNVLGNAANASLVKYGCSESEPTSSSWSTATHWQTRTAQFYANVTDRFSICAADGRPFGDSNGAKNSFGVAPCFCF